jgi:hypothetical protein
VSDSDERELDELLEELGADLEKATLELELVMAGVAGRPGRLSDPEIAALALQLMRVAEAGALVLRRYAR